MGGNATCLAAISPTFVPQLMTTAMISVQDHELNQVNCRALLDTCATANFISEGFAKRLKLPITTYTICGINATNTMTRGVIRVVIQSLHNEFTRELTCLTIPVISDLVPAEVFPRNSIDIPGKIVLADPQFYIPRAVEILIGAGAILSLFTSGQINLSRANGDLYLQNTRLEWVVAGGNAVSYQSRNALCALTDLEQQIAKFWTSEEVQGNTSKSIEESDCEMHFLTHVTRNNDGRYVVRLPFRNDGKRLGKSRTIAIKRMYSLERKLDSDSALKLATRKSFKNT